MAPTPVLSRFRPRSLTVRRGAVTIEMAVVAPLLVALILGVVDVGQHVHVAQMVSSASREGARLAAKNATANVSDVETAVSSYLAACFPSIPQETLDQDTTIAVTNSAGNPIPAGNLTTVSPGSIVTVSVTLPFDTVRWLDALPALSDTSLSSETTMRRE